MVDSMVFDVDINVQPRVNSGQVLGLNSQLFQLVA